jgi:hypothetical protein
MLLYRQVGQELEVFLLKSKDEKGNARFSLPSGDEAAVKDIERQKGELAIELEPVMRQGIMEKALALEEELREDIHKFFDISEKEGLYVASKEAFKKLLPHQYVFLKELQEVLRERNLMRHL